MKHLKVLGLAVAIMALVALAIAGTASATVLCKNNKNTSNCSEIYGAGTEVEAVLDPGTGPVKLTTSFKTIECEEVRVGGKIENAGSSTTTVVRNIETLVIAKCNCEIKVLKKGSAEVHWIEGTDDGFVTGSGGEITSSCSTIFGNVHCIYLTNASEGKITGGNPATLDVESVNVPRLTTNGLCAEEASADGKFETTTPNPLYVAAG